MNISLIQRLALLTAGMTGLAVGITVLLFPEQLYAQSGVILTENSSLMSEVRAPAGSIIAASILWLLALRKETFVRPALGLAVLMYLSYASARLVSITLDGLPSASLLSALGVELGVGLFCLYSLVRLPVTTRAA